jgi:hypothetical protein
MREGCDVPGAAMSRSRSSRLDSFTTLSLGCVMFYLPMLLPRSKGPIKRQSTPGNAAISLT